MARDGELFRKTVTAKYLQHLIDDKCFRLTRANLARAAFDRKLFRRFAIARNTTSMPRERIIDQRAGSINDRLGREIARGGFGEFLADQSEFGDRFSELFPVERILRR